MSRWSRSLHRTPQPDLARQLGQGVLEVACSRAWSAEDEWSALQDTIISRASLLTSHQHDLAGEDLSARVDAAGNLISLLGQDRSQWDHALIAEGMTFLDLSAASSELTEYHLEAAIASIHACAPRTEDTDWATIVSLYDTLMTIRPSPIVALNRAIAVAQNAGPEHGLEEIRSIAHRDRLAAYPFYSAALGELELRRGRHEAAREHFRAALALAHNSMERRFLDRRISACGPGDAQRAYYEQFCDPGLVALETNSKAEDRS
jgi:tetratricopeptide (TPR) repeat protein